ncbi:hypothetical protein HYH03_000390 [Edaphochlamys debaryana]|uniref:EGF-like domain-containing protein n=1 Tax=Edaphochlamys debaryana TaxID=47281 RepID=A0A835YHE7_9CHLO|nr:hypothetical protein HYH03_000390 [Edaphochlamys debaryana]|eukprot:KAG2501892.1 hypothetical protein HYH03_000390 [Edaphochlamys debaryana]
MWFTLVTALLLAIPLASQQSISLLASTFLRELQTFTLPHDAYIHLTDATFVRGAQGDPANVTKPTYREPEPESGSDAAVRHRCAVSKGTWCGEYIRQAPIPSRPVPRGSKDCPNACSGWGTCDHDTGFCLCPAGRGSPDCGSKEKRPCAPFHRDPHFPNKTSPENSVGPDGLDVGPATLVGWTASRCFGFCDTDVAACYCGYGKYRHIPAPPGSPPWTPPTQQGRTLVDSCQAKTDAEGKPTFSTGSGVSYEQIYGPQGYCNDLKSPTWCQCTLEQAPPCDGSVPMEKSCANQCSGHGECYSGYCRCHEGWYGMDCSRKKAGSPMEPGLHETSRPWLKSVMEIPPAALEAPPPTRRKPLIYVYDMPAAYTSRMLQYRIVTDACVWRAWTPANTTRFTGYTYGIETLFHEMLLQSEHRTFDPEEADFFYVPMYITCYFWPVMGYADFPWWHGPTGLRPHHGANMITEAHQWLSTNLPWWKRRGGRDHIWIMAADEGACWMPAVPWNTSIILTHWGRMDPNPKSNTAYVQDDYSANYHPAFDSWPGGNFRDRIAGHPCYDPKKDLVIPSFKAPQHYVHSPLLGAPPYERDILLYFRGDVGHNRIQKNYSRGIRQRIFMLAYENKWWDKHKIMIVAGGMTNGGYSEQLARSKFCLAAPGDGFATRVEDAILHGCVPLIVMDEVHAVYESILDYDSFSIRIRESALEAVPDILNAVTPAQLAKMQRHLARVWHRYVYATGPMLRSAIRDHMTGNLHNYRGGAVFPPPTPPDHPYQRHTSFPFADDAFGTIMQWLYHRIPDTRG